jgi:phenylacetate-CoA ligase
MAEIAAEQGVDLRAGPVRMTLHGGEPGASLPATKRRIEDLFGAKCMDTCGMTEIGHLGWECWAQAGLHLNEGDFVVEVVDPYSGLPVPPGRRGELVVTTLWRWASPVVRYRTGDVVELTHDPCICGRTYARALGGILGRRDDLLVVRGVNVFPSTLENLVRRHPEVAEFRIEAFRQRGMLELALQVECVPSVTSNEARDRLCGAIARDVRLATGLRLACTPVPPGTLPRFELKARRVVNLADDTNSPGFSTGSVDP